MPKRSSPIASLDALAEVADAEHDPLGAVAREQAQLVQQERLAGDLDQRLGRVRDPLAEPGAEPAGEDADRRQAGGAERSRLARRPRARGATRRCTSAARWTSS